MTVYCRYCGMMAEEVSGNGDMLTCAFCGYALMYERSLVEEEVPGGEGNFQGSLLRRGYELLNAEYTRTSRSGEDKIRMLITSLKIDDSVEISAIHLYQLLHAQGFTWMHNTDYIAAACLYAECRTREQPYLLYDFSEILGVSVYVMAVVFFQLCLALHLEKHPKIREHVDPSLYIHRLTKGLVDKLDQDTMPSKDTVNNINMTALRILASMKHDWMQTGRKPSGLCGAAVYIAALSHGVRFPKSEVMTVVNACEAGLAKCLIESVNTESGGLTILEFKKQADDFVRDQLDGCPDKSGKHEVLCMHKEAEVHAHGLCNKCYDECVKLSGGPNVGTYPPTLQSPGSEEVARNDYKESEELAIDDHKRLSREFDTKEEEVPAKRHKDHLGANEPSVPFKLEKVAGLKN